MSNAVMIIGESGTGKSTSARNLPADKTFYINVSGKPLPFKGWKGNYKAFSKDDPSGNYLATDNVANIIKVLEHIDKKMSHIEYIIIDDYQYTMANEFMRRADEKGYEKFTEIGQKAWMLAESAKNLRDNLNVVFLTHSEEFVEPSGARRQKAKTVGKLVDNVVTLEGMFTVVLYTNVEKTGDGIEYNFITQNNGSNTAKSPMGMFEEIKVPNDLKLVFDKIDEYYFS